MLGFPITRCASRNAGITLARQAAQPTASVKSLTTASNAVIAELIGRGVAPMEVTRPWQGAGRAAALSREKEQIARRLREAYLIANRQYGDSAITVATIVKWLCAE